MHTVFALLCFVVVIHWLIFPYPSGLLHWHCGNLTIAPVPAKQPWWIWIKTSCEFIMNDCITTTKQSTTKPCAYFLGYTVCPCRLPHKCWPENQNTLPCALIYYRSVHYDVFKWIHFPRYWPFVRGIHRSPVDSLTKSSDEEIWGFLWSAPGQTVETTIETQTNWDAIAIIMKSL